MKNIAVMGSTGSIGTQTLAVVREHPELFHVSVLAANSSDELMEKQIDEFGPELAVLSDEAAYKRLKSRYNGKRNWQVAVRPLLTPRLIQRLIRW